MYLGDFWCINLNLSSKEDNVKWENLTNETIGTPPCSRYGHSMMKGN